MSKPIAPAIARDISLVVISKNCARTIALTLSSVDFVAEKIVVDCGSTDETASIATAHGARVIQQDWLGFGPQKNFATNLAKHEWILSLDGDEWASPQMAQTIRSLTFSDGTWGYAFPRSNKFLWRYLRHGGGYPDYCLRLFHRAHARWSDDKVHEKVLCEMKEIKLSGDILHDSSASLAQYLEKQNSYTTLSVTQAIEQGKCVRPWELVVSPLTGFIKTYFFRLGFLDGWPGLVHIVISCFNSFMKKAKMLEMQNSKKINSL